MTSEPPPPLDPSFRIELPSFEGPLDLLLHLAHKHELDILDLPIAFVTERYLEYLGLMKQLHLDVASEYLVMAAELARIKSKSLLPQTAQDDEDEEGEEDQEDPRAELIRKLLEYQKYKKVGEELGSYAIAGRDVFPRGTPAPEASGPAPLAEVSVFRLLDALQKVIERTRADVQFEVTAERISLGDRMNEITEMLKQRGACAFEELFDGSSSAYHVVVTFLAILEMAKVRMVRIFQPDPGASIQLEYKLLDAGDAEAGEADAGDTGAGEAAIGDDASADGAETDGAAGTEQGDRALDLEADSGQDPTSAAPSRGDDEQDPR